MENTDLRYMPTYDPDSVQYMRDELIDVGFEELYSLEDVDKALLQQNDEIVLMMINSVCGCAAGSARPGVALALQHWVIPDQLAAVFAGQDKMAVEYVRQRFLSEYMPSSPCIAIYKNGELQFLMQRKDLVHKSPEEISEILTQVFDQLCSRPGPSISPEAYDRLEYTVQCSSNIPRYQE
jgi:putative YphP/YqiW family bacilliredoxin